MRYRSWKREHPEPQGSKQQGKLTRRVLQARTKAGPSNFQLFAIKYISTYETWYDEFFNEISFEVTIAKLSSFLKWSFHCQQNQSSFLQGLTQDI